MKKSQKISLKSFRIKTFPLPQIFNQVANAIGKGPVVKRTRERIDLCFQCFKGFGTEGIFIVRAIF